MKHSLWKDAFRIAFILFLLFLATRPLGNPHDASFSGSGPFLTSEGNAPAEVRAEILDRLRAFQAGYTERDTSVALEFADRLFSREEIVILGTMPREVFVGHDEAAGLIREDWSSWGDCRFLIDQAHVSSQGHAAWFSTIGSVEFDLSRFLVLPLRLTGVLVKEGQVWRFQQIQYQFDLDMSFLLVTIIVLLVWLAIAVIMTLSRVFRGLLNRRALSAES